MWGGVEAAHPRRVVRSCGETAWPLAPAPPPPPLLYRGPPPCTHAGEEAVAAALMDDGEGLTPHREGGGKGSGSRQPGQPRRASMRPECSRVYSMQMVYRPSSWFIGRGNALGVCVGIYLEEHRQADRLSHHFSPDSGLNPFTGGLSAIDLGVESVGAVRWERALSLAWNLLDRPPSTTSNYRLQQPSAPLSHLKPLCHAEPLECIGGAEGRRHQPRWPHS